MKTSILFLAAFVLLVTSCGIAADETVGDTREKGSYLIKIVGSEGGPHPLVGKNVDTRWDAESGFIFMNTDENEEPIGTITLSIGTITDGKASILSAVVSKTDVKIGTAEELNARTFQLSGGTYSNIDSIKVGTNYISGRLNIKMERLLFWPEDQPESVTVTGSFVAVD